MKTGLRTVNVKHGYPLVGCLIDLLRDAPGCLLQIAREHPGEVVGFRLGPVTCYLVTAPDHVRHVLQDHWQDFTKGGMWKALRRLFGTALGSTEGDQWLRRRRIVQPLFSQARLAALADIMIDAIDRELSLLAERGSGVVVDLVAEMAVITQRAIVETLFGSDIDRRDAERLVEQVLIAFRELNLRMFLYFLPDQFPLPGDRAFQRAVASFDEAMLGLIRARRDSGEEHNDLLSQLLHARDEGGQGGMSDRELRDEVVGFFLAGNETTATAMSWIWYALDCNPDVDRRLRAEVEEVLGGRKPTYADLERLTYTRLVVQEALRMYPPAWMVPRFTEKDTVIGDFRIPAGSPIILSPYVSHRDPASWPAPEKFDPERFTSERSAGRPRYAYYPFGGGPRKCVGDLLAIMEGQLITAMTVQRFRLRLAPGSRVVPASASTLKPRHGMKMILDLATSN